MKLQKFLVAALVATFAFGTAQAQEGGASGSEFFFQSAPGMSDVTVGLDYRTQKFEFKGVPGELKADGFAIGAEYEYGLSDMLALGARLRYASLTTDGSPETTTKGLTDPELFLKGTSAMADSRIRYGVTLGLGLEDDKTATATEDGNQASGGFSLTPYVGYDLNAGPGILGARLSYAVLLERTTEGTPETKTTGGNMLGVAAFYEYIMSDMLFGGAIDFRSFGETEVNDVKQDNTYSPLGAQIYARIPLATSVMLLPKLAYDFSAGGDVFDTYNVMTLTVAARFGF